MTELEQKQRIASLQKVIVDASGGVGEPTEEMLIAGNAVMDDYAQEQIDRRREVRDVFKAMQAAQPIGGDMRTADKLERVAAQLSVERIQGWGNPLVVDIMDAVRRLRKETPKADTGEAVLSATPKTAR